MFDPMPPASSRRIVIVVLIGRHFSLQLSPALPALAKLHSIVRRIAYTGPRVVMGTTTVDRSSRRASRAFLFAIAAIPVAGYTDEESAFVPVTDAMLADPPAADWLTWRRTNDAWGYSPLDEITPENVAKLERLWTRPLRRGSQTATPLV